MDRLLELSEMGIRFPTQNHIECETKFRNLIVDKDKDGLTNLRYDCISCTTKQKTNEKHAYNIRDPLEKKAKNTKIEISESDRIKIFNKKIEPLPTLENLLQNYSSYALIQILKYG